MKQSIYNVLVPYINDKYIFFNCLSKKFFVFDGGSLEFYKNIMSNYESAECLPKNILDKLIEGGFYIAEFKDERSDVLKNFKNSISQPIYTLMILSTYNCNFNCWYCIQKHKDESLSDETIIRIKRHIKKYCLGNSIRKFEIAWFGGEPLLRFDKMEIISEYAKQFCDENDIEFLSSITTNGYLINKRMLEVMKRYNFCSFQITIDGCIDNHDSTRNENGLPSFERILLNIVDILSILPEANVALRFNYTENNLSMSLVDDVNLYIPINFRSKIEFIARPVWQCKHELIDLVLIKRIKDSFFNSGYKVPDIDIEGVNIPCYVENLHFNTVFHNGAVDKCSNMSIEEALGFLNIDGQIVWKGTPFHVENNILNSKSRCSECIYLPICFGPCPEKRRLQFKKTKEHDSIFCYIADKHSYFKELIVDYCEAKMTEK